MKKLALLLSPCVFIHRIVIRTFVRLAFGVSVVGKEHLNELDQFIIVANHNSHLDILLLYQILQPDKICRTHPLAALDYFKKPVWLYKIVNFLFRPIWVDRDSGTSSIFKEIQKNIDAGCSIIMFPEGTRGLTPKIQEFKSGIGLIAKRNPDVPIVPVYLESPERAFPKKASFPVPLLNYITISPPQVLTGDTKDITNDLYNHLKKIATEEMDLRQHRIETTRKPLVVSVIGIDGSGKSTLSRRLISFFQEECCFIGDELEMFNNGQPSNVKPLITNEIRKWVGKKAKYAKNLALYKVPKLAELLLRDRLLSEVVRWYRPDYVFMDGSPLLNMTAWAVLYREGFFTEESCAKALKVLSGNDDLPGDDTIFKQFPELLGLRKLKLNHLKLPDVVIFLDVAPVVCMERIISRGEKVQPHENIEKLTKLRNAYQLVCNVIPRGHHVYQLSGNKDLDQEVDEAVHFVKGVLKEKYAEN